MATRSDEKGKADASSIVTIGRTAHRPAASKSQSAPGAGPGLDRRPSGGGAPRDTMLSCRYELKYRIGEAKARALAAYVREYLPQDRYAQLRPDGQYPITSLYLDSNQLTLCRETLEKKKTRLSTTPARCWEKAGPCSLSLSSSSTCSRESIPTEVSSDFIKPPRPSIHPFP